MFKKKKEEAPKNLFLDSHRDKLIELGNRLYDQVEKIMIKQAVINIYPNGADQDKAKADLESAKQHLLCIIGEYDDVLNWYNINKKKYPEYKTVFFPNSHDKIEQCYRMVAKNIVLY